MSNNTGAVGVGCWTFKHNPGGGVSLVVLLLDQRVAGRMIHGKKESAGDDLFC